MFSEVIECVVGEKGELLPFTTGETDKRKKFVAKLPKGARVQILYAYTSGEVSAVHFAAVHGIIRAISEDTGNVFDDVKTEVKKRSGLQTGVNANGDPEYKSFGDCTREEIFCAITHAVDLGLEYGIIL